MAQKRDKDDGGYPQAIHRLFSPKYLRRRAVYVCMRILGNIILVRLFQSTVEGYARECVLVCEAAE